MEDYLPLLSRSPRKKKKEEGPICEGSIHSLPHPCGASKSSILFRSRHECHLRRHSQQLFDDGNLSRTDFVHGLLVVGQKDNIFIFESIGSGYVKLTDFENDESASHELKLV